MKKLLVVILIVAISLPALIACQAPSTPSISSPATTPTTSINPATSTAPTTSATIISSPPPTTAKPPTYAPATSTIPPATNTSAIQIGGTVTVIDPSTVGGPLGLPWLNRLNYVGCQLVQEPILSTLSDATLVPKLAESWDVNADPNNPSFTFHLRKGVKFSDGTDWNAQALVWNLKRYAEGGVLVTSRYIKSYDIIDDYTRAITFNSVAEHSPGSL